MSEAKKKSPDETLAVCSACQHDMPCGCKVGTELDRLNAEIANLRLLLKVQEMLTRAQDRTIETQDRLLRRLEVGE